MKFSRLLLSIISLILVLLAICILGGNNLLIYIDGVSAVCLLGFTIFPMLACFKLSGIKRALGTIFKASATDPAEIKFAQTFVKYWDSLTLFATFLTFMVGLIGMLAYLDDTSVVGPNLAVALITIFYYFIIKIAVFLPMKASLEIKN